MSSQQKPINLERNDKQQKHNQKPEVNNEPVQDHSQFNQFLIKLQSVSANSAILDADNAHSAHSPSVNLEYGNDDHHDQDNDLDKMYIPRLVMDNAETFEGGGEHIAKQHSVNVNASIRKMKTNDDIKDNDSDDEMYDQSHITNNGNKLKIEHIKLQSVSMNSMHMSPSPTLNSTIPADVMDSMQEVDSNPLGQMKEIVQPDLMKPTDDGSSSEDDEQFMQRIQSNQVFNHTITVRQ